LKYYKDKFLKLESKLNALKNLAISRKEENPPALDNLIA
jgi:hypothetical protein